MKEVRFDERDVLEALDEFIRDPATKKWIDNNDWEKVYKEWASRSLEIRHGTDYTHYLTNLLIKANVRDFLNHMSYVPFICFYGLPIVSFKIPNTIKELKESAFNQCPNLKAIDIPDSVEEIESACFYSCEKLREVTIGSGVKRIGNSAFAFCSLLREITFNNTMEKWKEATNNKTYWFIPNYTDSNNYKPRIVIHCTDGDIVAERKE